MASGFESRKGLLLLCSCSTVYWLLFILFFFPCLTELLLCNFIAVRHFYRDRSPKSKRIKGDPGKICWEKFGHNYVQSTNSTMFNVKLRIASLSVWGATAFVAQRIARQTSDLKVAGSSPAGGLFFTFVFELYQLYPYPYSYPYPYPYPRPGNTFTGIKSTNL